jgi:hypothetical protein
VIYQLFLSALDGPQGPKLKFVMLVLVLAFPTIAQERKVDPTWLHRYVPHLREVASKMSLESCHFKPIFGEGDSEAGLMQSVTRFAEVTIDPNGNCQPVLYDREETAGSDTSSAAFDKVMEAITNRDNQTLARLLAATPGIANQTGRHPRWGGRPQPLHVAIESDNHQALALLLDTGANVDGDNRDYDGWSPLMIAVHWQRVAMREELIRRGATIDLNRCAHARR